MRTAEEDGWPAVRLAVLRRDRGCVAVQSDLAPADLVAKTMCRDKWGTYHPFDALFKLELDHVIEFPTLQKKAPDDEAHLQAVCSLHHDTWARRQAVREWSRERLSELYPDAWKAWLER